MDNTINGRTPEEIKRGLKCCKPVWVDNHWKTCDTKCPYIDDVGGFCRAQLMADAHALALIQQLERERDAAVEQLRKGGRACSTCKFSEDIPENDKICEECRLTGTKLLYSNWEWVGPQEVE